MRSLAIALFAAVAAATSVPSAAAEPPAPGAVPRTTPLAASGFSWFSERPVYAPGDVLRLFVAKRIAGSVPAAAAPVELSLFDEAHLATPIVVAAPVALDVFGTAVVAIPIPPDAAAGTYVVRTRDGATFLVGIEPPRPLAVVSAVAPQILAPGRIARVTAHVVDARGLPVARAALRYLAALRPVDPGAQPEVVLGGDLVTDADGTAEARIPLLSSELGRSLLTTFTLTAPGLRSLAVTVRTSVGEPSTLPISPTEVDAPRGRPFAFRARVRTIAGPIADTALVVRLHDVDDDRGSPVVEPPGSPWRERAVVSDADGDVRLPPVPVSRAVAAETYDIVRGDDVLRTIHVRFVAENAACAAPPAEPDTTGSASSGLASPSPAPLRLDLHAVRLANGTVAATADVRDADGNHVPARIAVAEHETASALAPSPEAAPKADDACALASRVPSATAASPTASAAAPAVTIAAPERLAPEVTTPSFVVGAAPIGARLAPRDRTAIETVEAAAVTADGFSVRASVLVAPNGLRGAIDDTP